MNFDFRKIPKLKKFPRNLFGIGIFTSANFHKLFYPENMEMIDETLFASFFYYQGPILKLNEAEKYVKFEMEAENM